MLEWLDGRLRWRSVVRFLSTKIVPQHRHAVWYLFGGLASFFFGLQIITGMLLLIYYSPTPNTAHESVQFIMTQVPMGWLVRSIHSWSANLMIFCVLVHFFSTFFMKAYRKPRELLWLTGVLLLFLVLGFGFTGYLLPWDTTAYFATQIGTEIPKSVPIIGDLATTVIRGGEYVADESLKRLFALHVVILPIISLLLVLLHLVLNQVHGTSVPLKSGSAGPGIRFFPNYIYRDLLSWTGALIVLTWLSTLFPVALGTKADPFASAPIGIKPEWYFLTLYQTLRFLPSSIFGVSGELIANTCVLVLGLFLLALPFLDRQASRGETSPLFTAIGLIALLYMAIAITAAYLA